MRTILVVAAVTLASASGASFSAVAQDKWPDAYSRGDYKLGMSLSQFKATPYPDLETYKGAYPLCTDEKRAGNFPYNIKVGNEGLAGAGVVMCQFYYDDTSGGYKAFPRRLGLDLNGLQRETTFYFMPDDDPSVPILFEIDTFGPSGSVASMLPVLERDYGTAIRVPETLHNSRGDPIENDLYEWRKGGMTAVLGSQDADPQRFPLIYMSGSMEDKVNRLRRKLWLEGANKP